MVRICTGEVWVRSTMREPRRFELIQAAGGGDGGERRVPHPGHLVG